ncbi:hypothetical protein AB0J71_24075 [Nonomuraea sp. NPDC049637]|uniref:hypothetical protein n=1 Tax=Nonomuraea sp. NPDC049637 TaxID=3154356 RepID=UPI00343137B0
MDVLPLHRDGAYVVASFDITRTNDGTFIPRQSPSNADRPGGRDGGARVQR